VDTTPIVRRLQRIEDALEALRPLSLVDRDTFLRDPYLAPAAERYLQVAIQAALDIGSILLAEHGQRPPNTYAEVFEALASAGILPSDLAARLVPMARFRNVLVHLYLDVDAARVYSYIYIQHCLGDLSEFVRSISRYLLQQSTDEPPTTL